MRAFDLLSKAELDIRTAAQPRYHFEMALLRWMHLRKLVPLTDLMERMGEGGGGARLQAAAGGAQASVTRSVAPHASAAWPVAPAPRAVSKSRPVPPVGSPPPPAPRPSAEPPSIRPMKEAFLAEVRAGKSFFYNTVVAQAQRIEVTSDAITFAFLPTHRALREQFDDTRAWLEATAERVAGRRISVTAVQVTASTIPPRDEAAPKPAVPGTPAAARDLRAEALSSSAVQAMLEVFPAEISDVEEM
jgi:DNA polymerase-3 subunit gamma/tau